MATQQVTAQALVSEATSGAFQKVFDHHPSEDLVQYLDSRDMGGILLQNGLQSMAHVVSGSITGATASSADGIDVLLPFTPKAVIVINETDSLAYLKVQALPTTLKFATTPAFTFSATGLLLNNLLADNNQAFHVQAAELAADGKVLHYIAIG